MSSGNRNYGTISPDPPRDPQQPPAIRWTNMLFYFFCFITGQLHYDHTEASVTKVVLSVFSVVFCGLLLVVNLGSLVFNIYVVAVCPYKDCSYFCSKYYHSSQDDDMYLLAINSSSTVIDLRKYYNWNKMLITMATFAAFSSYYLMVFLILIPLYSIFKYCTSGLNKKYKGCLEIVCARIKQAIDHGYYLQPFDDSAVNSNISKSTPLKPIQSFYFSMIYLLNLSLYFGSLFIFIFIIINRVTTDDMTNKSIDISGLLFQFSSQFCAIQSCFIFSKVAYAVSNRCDDVLGKFVKTDVSGERENLEDRVEIVEEDEEELVEAELVEEELDAENVNFCNSKYIRVLLGKNFVKGLQRKKGDDYQEALKNARFAALRKIDDKFITKMKASLDPYGHWFAIHWILYTITTFMSIAFLAETCILYIYSPHDHEVSWLHDRRKRNSFIYIVLFTLEHTFLFIYPCFRASQITSSREKLIKRFSEHQWNHIPLSVQSYFVEYLKTQNFGFKIVFLCMKITFGFNLAFVSIFVGGFGVILKLSL